MVPIKMTDFGIKPPTAIFGRLKTGDEVKVNFELNVGARAIAPRTASRKPQEAAGPLAAPGSLPPPPSQTTGLRRPAARLVGEFLTALQGFPVGLFTSPPTE
jgi:hypothetical protein